MPDDDFDENNLKQFDRLGSKTALKKGNALVDGLKWIIRQYKKQRRAPMNILMNTDSLPVIVQVDATIVDSDAGTGFVPPEVGNQGPDIT